MYANNVDSLSRADLLLILQFSNISAAEAADGAARLATLVHLLTEEQRATFLSMLGRTAPARSVLALEDPVGMTGNFPLQDVEEPPFDPAYSGTFSLRSIGRIEAAEVTDMQILWIIVGAFQELILKGDIGGVQSDSVSESTRILSGLRLEFEEAAGYCGDIVDILSKRIVTTCTNFGDMEDISLDCCSNDATLLEYAQRLHAEFQTTIQPSSDPQQGEGDSSEERGEDTTLAAHAVAQAPDSGIWKIDE
jgi:hypothetical protein